MFKIVVLPTRAEEAILRTWFLTRSVFSRIVFPEVHTELELMTVRSKIDPMTGYFRWDAYEGAARRVDDDPGLAIVLVDIDGLKWVNDTISYRRGSAMIRNCAKWMAQVVERPPFEVPPAMRLRPGGDEFAFIVAIEHADALVEALDGWAYSHAAHRVTSSLSVGWGSTEKQAEASMKVAKRLNKQIDAGLKKFGIDANRPGA